MKLKKSIRSIVAILILGLLLAGLFLLLTVNLSFLGKKSIHEDARTYRTRHCLAFYPDGEEGRSQARSLCKGVKEDRIYDYSLIPYGDYYLVSYGNEHKYFTDHQYQKPQIMEVSDMGKKIIGDYLRYTIKQKDPDRYYDPDFLTSLQPERLDFSGVSYRFEEDALVCHFPDQDLDVPVPLKNIQKEIGMDFGFSEELYRKPVYIDPDHPIICLTFDDGPDFWSAPGDSSTERIVELLYRYDACGTFYVCGYNLENRDVWTDYQVYSLLKRMVNQGNEFGSHTQTHGSSLIDLATAEEIYDEISGPIDFLKRFLNYEIVSYRPVSGEFNADVLSSQPVGAILWDVDSEDWYLEDADAICEKVLHYSYETGDVIIFHDIYDVTADALEKIVPQLISQGCQLVSVSDMLRELKIDVSTLKYYYGPNYYE